MSSPFRIASDGGTFEIEHRAPWREIAPASGSWGIGNLVGPSDPAIEADAVAFVRRITDAQDAALDGAWSALRAVGWEPERLEIRRFTDGPSRVQLAVRDGAALFEVVTETAGSEIRVSLKWLCDSIPSAAS
jgi:hypothetical protein